jgi:hypothetical protein
MNIKIDLWSLNWNYVEENKQWCNLWSKMILPMSNSKGVNYVSTSHKPSHNTKYIVINLWNLGSALFHTTSDND